MATSNQRIKDNIGVYRYAENLALTASINPSQLHHAISRNRGSIHDKLLEMFIKLSSHQSAAKITTSKHCSNLLSKLVHKDKLNTLIVNLKRLDEGYSIMLKSSSGEIVETTNLSYNEQELLDFIEQEEIPHNLVDILEQSQPKLFYDGCIVAEIRDSRRSLTGSYKTSYVLLRPSHRSILADINSMTSDQYRWSQDDRFTLESQLLIATNEPLCLDPSPAVNIAKNRLQFKSKIAQKQSLRRAVKLYTAKGHLRQRMLARLRSPKELCVHDFLKSQEKTREVPKPTSNLNPWMRPPVDLAPVDSSDVSKLAKELDRSNWLLPGSGKANSDFSANIVEEYTLETERLQGKKTKLVILQREAEDKFMGELHIERNDWSVNKCSFDLGTAPLKDKYIKQFIEIFTEEGRKQVKITHMTPGQPTQVHMSGQGSTAAAQSPGATSVNLSGSSSSLKLSVGSQLSPSVQQKPDEAENQTDRQTRDSIPLHSVTPAASVVLPAAKQVVSNNPNSNMARTAFFMSKSGNSNQLGQIQILGIQNNAANGGSSSSNISTLNLHSIQGLQTVQGISNLQQVSLSNINSGSVAVPVSLIGNMSVSQPILLSGMSNIQSASGANVTDNKTNASRSMILTSQAGSGQQIVTGQHGLITLPVSSSLAQQLLAANANKRQQTASLAGHSINLVTGQPSINQRQTSTNSGQSQVFAHSSNQQIFTSQIHQTQSKSTAVSAVSSALAASSIQLPSNMRAPNVQLNQVLHASQSQRASQANPSNQHQTLQLSSKQQAMQVVHQPTYRHQHQVQQIQQQQGQQTAAFSRQINSQHINIITSNQLVSANQTPQIVTSTAGSQRSAAGSTIMHHRINNPDT